MIGPARYWREIPQRYRYEAAKCTQCSKISFPPRLVCSGCRGRSFEKTTLAQTGTVQTFTVIHVAPSGFEDEVPYAVGVVKLEDGVKITGQIVDCDLDTLATGDPVRMEFRRVQAGGSSGVLCYGYKFVPATA